MSPGIGTLVRRIACTTAGIALALFGMVGKPQPAKAADDQVSRMEVEIARLIDKEIADRGVITPSVRNEVHDAYFSAFEAHVSDFAKDHYPGAMKGRAYTLMMTVSVLEDGSFEKAQIERSSGSAEIDHAALKLARDAAPFPPFSPVMRERYGVVDVSSEWIFGQAPANE